MNSTLETIDSAELEETSGGLKWRKGRRSKNIEDRRKKKRRIRWRSKTRSRKYGY